MEDRNTNEKSDNNFFTLLQYIHSDIVGKYTDFKTNMKNIVFSLMFFLTKMTSQDRTIPYPPMIQPNNVMTHYNEELSSFN